MKLAIESSEAACIRVQISGGITSKELANDEDPLATLCGADVYSRNVVINLRENDYIDSSGISWLLGCHRQFQEDGGRMVLHSLAPFVMNVIRIMKMNVVLDLANDVAEAERKLQDQERGK